MAKAKKIEKADLSPVLIVTPWYKPTIGGVAEVADRLFRLLEMSGVETQLWVCKGDRAGHTLSADAGSCKIWRINIPSSAMYNMTPKSLLAMLIYGPVVVRKILQFIRNHHIRTVLLLFPIGYVWPFLIIKHLAAVKIIASYHGNDLTRFESQPLLLRYLMRNTLKAADAVTVCAHHLEAVAQQIAGPKVLDIHLIDNCVDCEEFIRPEQHLDRRVEGPVSFIHVSNFNPKKRTKDIVQAFAMAKLPAETRLVMVGNGPDYAETRQLAESLGAAGRVEFAGAQKDVRSFLWRADIFVLASDDEGAPLVLLEAMASGLAWISTPWGAAETLPPGECGLVVPPGSPEKLAAAMEELVRDPERRKGMGRRGRERAEKDFSSRVYAEKHCRLIRMVQRGQSPGWQPALPPSL